MSDLLMCPVCRADVRGDTSMCMKCHLPMKDVLAHQPQRPTLGMRMKRLRSALVALVVYAAIAIWCAAKLPDALSFVVPGVAAGAYLHAVRGKPWLGAMAALVIVVVVPALLWPSMLTGAFSDLANWRP